MNEKIKDILEWIYCIIIAVVLALLFRYFIGTPTIVKMESMKPTLEQNQRLWLNRWGRTTHKLPERGQIITFEEPAKLEYSASEIDQSNPVAKYNKTTGVEWFFKAMEMYSYIAWRSIIFKCIGIGAMFLLVKEQSDYVIYGAILIFVS